MPVVAESISLLNPTSVKCLNDSLMQSFKKSDKENLENHISPTASQVLSAKIDYIQAKVAESSLNNFKSEPRYVLLKPNQQAINVNPATPTTPSITSYAKVLQTNNNGVSPTSSASSKSSSSSTPQLPKPKRVLYDKSKIHSGWVLPQVKNWSSGCGFNNVGNTCYLNSALQAFLHVPALAQWLLTDMEHRTRCKEGGNCLVCNMTKLLQQTHQTHQMSSFTPSMITSRLSSICKLLTLGRQEDSHEFLRGLIEKMEKTYLNSYRDEPWFKGLDQYSKETTPINEILGGYLRSTVTCLSCNHESVTFQHFQDLPLDITRFMKLSEAIDGFFSRETLEECGYKCESCKKRVSATKKFTIERLPVVLCIQLKRFSAVGGKINKPITITEDVSLQKYLSKTCETNQKSKYKFVSMVTHLGSSPASGHYTAVGKAPDNNFYEFDDRCVRQIQLENALRTSAYVLFYEMEQQQNDQTSLVHQNGHSVIHQNMHTYSKHDYNSSSVNSTKSPNGSISNGFSKPCLPRVIAHNQVKFLKNLQKENDSPKNGGGKPSGINHNNINGNSNGDTLKFTNGHKRENSDHQFSLQNKKVKMENSHNMPNLREDDDENENDKITPPLPPLKRLVPYESDDEEEGEWNDGGKVKTSAGVFLETDYKENIKGPSMQGSTIITKASTENHIVKRNDDTVQQLSKLHHNGYGSSNVISWSNQSSQMNKEINKDQQNEDRKRHYENDDDVEMDRGRLKKIKIHSKSPLNNKLPNPFQEHQNAKNHNNNGYLDRSYHANNNNHHYHNNRSGFTNNGSNGYRKTYNNKYNGKNSRYNNFRHNNYNNNNNNRVYGSGNPNYYNKQQRRE